MVTTTETVKSILFSGESRLAFLYCYVDDIFSPILPAYESFGLDTSDKTNFQVTCLTVCWSKANGRRVAASFPGRVRFSKFRAGLLKYYVLELISDLFKVPSYEYMCT